MSVVETTQSPSTSPFQYGIQGYKKAAHDFTLDHTDVYDNRSNHTLDFTLEPTHPNTEEGLDFTLEPTYKSRKDEYSRSPSLSLTPKKNSLYTKTPKKLPAEPIVTTSPSLSLSASSPNLRDPMMRSSNHYSSRNDSIENRNDVSSLCEPMIKKYNQGIGMSANTESVLKNGSASLERGNTDSCEQKLSQSITSRKRKREAPSSKSSYLDGKLEGNSRKTKRSKISRNMEFSKVLKVCCSYVKRCIGETEEKLEKKRFKLLCGKVSNQLVCMWQKRKPTKKKGIKKWLQRRHVKILRLVKKYVEKELV